jgi:hypothetical protein
MLRTSALGRERGSKKGVGGGENNPAASMYTKCEEAGALLASEMSRIVSTIVGIFPPEHRLHKEVRDLLSAIGTSISRETDDTAASVRLKARLCELLRDYSRFCE